MGFRTKFLGSISLISYLVEIIVIWCRVFFFALVRHPFVIAKVCPPALPVNHVCKARAESTKVKWIDCRVRIAPGRNREGTYSLFVESRRDL